MNVFWHDVLYWLKVTRRYRRQDPYHYASKPYEERRRRELTRLFQKHKKPGGRLLDVGCSEGQCTLALAPLFEEVLALDMSFMAVRRARRNAGALGVRHARFQSANIRTADFPGSFDAVFAGDVLYSLGRKHSREAFENLLRRLAGALKPGGLLLLAHVFGNDAERQERLGYRAALQGMGLSLLEEEMWEDKCAISLLEKHGPS